MRRARALTAAVSACLLVSLAPPALAGGAGGGPPATPVATPALPGLSQLLEQTGLPDLLRGLLTPGTSPSALPPAVVSQVAASTVRVLGRGCGGALIGSGFAAAPDTVVTNAHVVAGIAAPQVQRPDGTRLPAQVQVFDPDRDLAVLAVPGLRQAPLALAPPVAGTDAAVFGHPEGQAAVAVIPARIVRRLEVDTDNIYGQTVRRQILVMATYLEPGDSGGPVVDTTGRVVGVAFAMSALRRYIGLADVSDDVAAVLARPRAGAVSTGPCLP